MDKSLRTEKPLETLEICQEKFVTAVFDVKKLRQETHNLRWSFIRNKSALIVWNMTKPMKNSSLIFSPKQLFHSDTSNSKSLNNGNSWDWDMTLCSGEWSLIPWFSNRMNILLNWIKANSNFWINFWIEFSRKKCFWITF